MIDDAGFALFVLATIVVNVVAGIIELFDGNPVGLASIFVGTFAFAALFGPIGGEDSDAS